MHHQLTDAPIDVVEAKGRDFGGAQSETGERGEDREVAAPYWGTAVAGGQQAPDVAGFEALRQARQSPSGHRRYGRDQWTRDRPLDMEKTQE
jgi:hypothetical protein